MVQNNCIEIRRMSTMWVYMCANHLNYAGFPFNYSLHQALFYFVFNGEVRNYPLLLSLNRIFHIYYD